MPPKTAPLRAPSSARKARAAPPKRAPASVPAAPVKTEGLAWDAVESLTYCGTEFDKLELIDEHSWGWEDLVASLSPGGELYEDAKDKFVYLFAQTEPQFVQTEKHPDGTDVFIPVVVAVVSRVRIASRIGVKTVQLPVGKVLPSKFLHMSFDAMPLATRRRRIVRRVYTLQSSLRASVGSRVPIERRKLFEYANPFFFVPRMQAQQLAEDALSPMVAFTFKHGRRAAELCFDFEEDDADEFAAESATKDLALKEADFTPAEWRRLLDRIKAEAARAAAAAKKEFEDDRRARTAELEALSAAERAALDELKTVKFYPSHPAFDVSKFAAPFAGRYLGPAGRVVVCAPAPADADADEESSEL